MPVPLCFYTIHVKPMKILLITPTSVEYKMCKKALAVKTESRSYGCKTGTAACGQDSILVVKTGPGKTRTAVSTTALIGSFAPDILLDTGSCGGISPGIQIGELIIGDACVEYDLYENGFPQKSAGEIQLQSALALFNKKVKRTLLENAVAIAQNNGYGVRVGTQACGEYIIKSERMKQALYDKYGVSGCNWETAAVFISALRCSLPAFSLRVVSDLADSHVLKDFFKNIRPCTYRLYGYIGLLCEAGWFTRFYEQWLRLKKR